MNIQTVSQWRSQLGYLPVPLNFNSDRQCFVMLNGAKGNFCLDVERDDVERQEQRVIAWSSDVDHYVRVRKDKVDVLRWDMEKAVSSSVSDVVNNLQAFQQYLESARAPREQSIVAHAVTTYNRIRAARPDGNSGLQAFLFALYQAMSEFKSKKNPIVWGDLDECEDHWRNIGASLRDRILSDFLRPRANDKAPNIELMLRHAAGRIFQEAHNLVAISPQANLFGDNELQLIGSSARSSGAYFTPTPLVRTLVEQCLTKELLKRQSLVILDAACGSGEFLRESIRQLDLLGYKGQLRVVGFDVSMPAVYMARFALSAETAHHGKRVTIDIQQADALDADWPQDVDLCLMNPPYASWTSLTAQAKERLVSILGDLGKPRPDLAFAFIVKASQCLAKGGMLGAVIPASLLDGDSAAGLREFLDDKLMRKVIVRLGNQSIFDEAMVDASLYVGQRQIDQPREANTLMVWADHTSGASDRALRALRSIGQVGSDDPIEVNQKGFSIYSLSNADRQVETWAPRPFESRKLLRDFDELPQVSDLYVVKQGAITGLNSAFLLNGEQLSSLPKSERKFFRKATVNASIGDGAINSDHWVFYPYGTKQIEIPDEKHLIDMLPDFYSYFLKPHQAALSKRAGIDKARWWDLTRRRGEVFDLKAPKIITTYFGSAGSFAWDKTGEHVAVQGYAWVPRHPDLDDERIGQATVAVLGATMTNHLIAAISNNLAGGQYNLSARFIGRMPFVDMRNPRLTELVDALALIGSAMAHGQSYSAEERDNLAGKLFMSAARAS